MEPKQYIVMRKDLNMRKGKMIAQGAHASMKVLLELMEKTDHDILVLNLGFEGGYAIKEWIEHLFTKICVGVNSEEELLAIYEKAENLGLPCEMVDDAGLTEFHGIETKTCCAIGPAYPEDFKGIMEDFKLL